MRNKGYIYTLVVMSLVLIIVSLISYYIIASQPSISSSVNRMRTDELHYFVESVETDYSRSVDISSQRAFIYLIDYSIKNNKTFDNYIMRNCTSFNPTFNGSQAAALELMLCGTLEGNPLDSMENHTILKWVQRMKLKASDLNFVLDASIRDIELIPYDPWNFYTVSKFDLIVYDKLNQTFYKGYDLPVVAKINIENFEDPLYAIKTGSSSLVRYFTPCDSSSVVDAHAIGVWIDNQCYNARPLAPSFFDRLDGRLNASQKYIIQSQKVEELELEVQDIGMESFADLDEFAYYNVTANYNLTWVDYSYWNNVLAYCQVMNFTGHRNFRIDFEHAVDYDVRDLNCSILILDRFIPNNLWLPLNSTVTWMNGNLADTCTLSVNANGWGMEELIPTEQEYWFFNETGHYTMNCTLSPAGGSFSGVIDIINATN